MRLWFYVISSQARMYVLIIKRYPRRFQNQQHSKNVKARFETCSYHLSDWFRSRKGKGNYNFGKYKKMYSYPTLIAKGKIKNLVIKIRKHGHIEALNRYQHTTPRPIILQLNMIHNQSCPYFVNPSV